MDRDMMKEIRAIGFDLFDTLIVTEHSAREYALERLVDILRGNGFAVEFDEFVDAYLAICRQHILQARLNNRETHNSYWIRDTLLRFGYDLPAEDPRISETIQVYFQEFINYTRLLPGTLEMLAELKPRYRLGLLSNFTYAPAVRNIINQLGLQPYLDVVLISGDTGHRKPGSIAFGKLVEALQLPRQQVAYIGDNPDTDIKGAREAGLQPILTTYGRNFRNQLAGKLVKAPYPEPEPPAPRIDSWEELLELLNGK